MAGESLNKELTRRREETAQFYKALYDEDDLMIEKEANDYVKSIAEDSISDIVKQAYLDGRKQGMLQPHSKLIHLISMYAYDYIPKNITLNLKNVTSKIRTILRDDINPEWK